MPNKVPDKEPEDNLGKRQKALNAKVNQAVHNKVDFNEIKETIEASDLDKLFKIDVAAKYVNSDYIIDVLKSGDSYYVTRAMNKCLWLYDEYHIHIINPDFLHKNVFPFMSNKMKKKLLTAVSKHVRTEKRAVEFYHYCMKMKLINMAFKFLLFTTEEFKRDLMLHHNDAPFNKVIDKDLDYIKHLIGRSFSLLEAFFTMLPESRYELLLQFKYMYRVSNNKYVDLLEKYIIVKNLRLCGRFDLKLSNDIMTKHKERVLANPVFFEPLVNVNTFLKHTTVNDAKILAVALLPKTSIEFWKGFYRKYEHFLRKIPREETYAFIKKIFNDHYPESEFEMTREFYDDQFHQFMTLEEKEEWALRHLKSEKQILGVGCDYLWYQYVSFEISFEVLKNIILVTKDAIKRRDIINVLVKSARNDRELETLFIYYDKRHSNEVRPNQLSFLKEVIIHQNVFAFDEVCWAAFYKLLLNIELYNVLDFNESNQIYKTVTLVYYILHKLQLNEGLTEYLLHHFETSHIFEHLSKLNNEKQEVLYHYLFKYYIDQLHEFKDQIFTTDVSTRGQKYYRNITALLYKFRQNTSKPNQIKRVCNQPRKKRRVDNSLSDRELIRRLKRDTDLIRDLVCTKSQIGSELSAKQRELNECYTEYTFKIPNFLKKLKIYYSEDVAKTYLEMLEDLVSQNNRLVSIENSVFGIFQLANDKRKVDFMNEHMPQDSKINVKIETPQLRIQKAICSFLGYSRPPLPLANVRRYLTGDYVKFCTKLFDMYIAHIPIPMCVQFVESIIDSPVSIQKHGIRLAFKCFTSANLKKIILKIWSKTKNVSLRGIIYKTLYKKLMTEDDKELFDALKSFTLTLHQDDDDEIFGLFHDGVLPDKYQGHYYEALWHTVGKFKDKQPNINRKVDVINRMYTDMYLLNEEFVRTIVDEHINTMLTEKNLHLNYTTEEISRLCRVKWDLIVRYIIHFTTVKKVSDKYANVAEDIAGKCIEFWNEEYNDMNHFQVLCSEFVDYLKSESLTEVQYYENVIPAFESILNTLLKGLPLHDIYMLVWDLRLTIINRKVLQAANNNLNDDNALTEIIPKSAISLGREVGKLIIEFVESKTYFASFILDIKKAVSSAAGDLRNLNKYDEFHIKKVLLFVASGLVEHEFPETNIIALMLLPDSDCTSDLYCTVLEKINKCPDFEVRSALYKRTFKRKRNAIEHFDALAYAVTAQSRTQKRRRWANAKNQRRRF